MIRRPTTRRTGTSLLEVLVGLGILAIGAISAFVLFPFAAINVSRALVDDRATTCAITADGQLRDVHRKYVVEMEATPSGANEPYFVAMDNPAAYGAPATTQQVPKNSSGPSYPVFVDPMGWAISPTPVGGKGGTGVPTIIPRVTLSLILNSGGPGFPVARPAGEPEKLALRFCSQLDGLLFDEGGAVSTQNANDMRELRYNWMWVLQRPVNRDRLTVRQQVVVFNRRTHLYAAPNSEATWGNAPAFAAAGSKVTFTPGENTITGVPADAEVTKGTWVMDGTVSDTIADGDGVVRPKRHAEWYRVTSVTEVTTASPNGGSATTLTLEVHKPITRPDGLVSRVTPVGGVNAFAYNGTLVVFPGVIEVFERPVLTGVGAP